MLQNEYWWQISVFIWMFYYHNFRSEFQCSRIHDFHRYENLCFCLCKYCVSFVFVFFFLLFAHRTHGTASEFPCTFITFGLADKWHMFGFSQLHPRLLLLLLLLLVPWSPPYIVPMQYPQSSTHTHIKHTQSTHIFIIMWNSNKTMKSYIWTWRANGMMIKWYCRM